MRQVWAWIAFLAIFAGAATLAKAADPQGSPAAEGKGHSDAGEQKEPGLFEKALDLSLWTIVVFLVLLFVLRRYAWKPLLEGLEQREHSIHSAMEEAKKAREEAQALRNALAEEATKAQDKVREVLDQARRDAEKASAEMMAKAKTEIQSERDRLRREIETARDQAIQQLWNQTAELATLVSSKAIRRQLTAEDHRRLVEEAIADLDKASKQRQRVGASV
ncbi:MAG: F0F1 ATP synthase subunit B [Gemmataceae bacterium]